MEWNDTSLYMPLLDYKDGVVFVADMGVVNSDLVQPCIDELAKLIHDWNCKYTYDVKNCNDNHFVEACQNIIQEYNPDIALTSAMEDYVRICESFERCLKAVILSPAMQADIGAQNLKKYGFESHTNTIAFKCHDELDVFARFLDTFRGMDKERKDQLSEVVKGLDRGFWMCGKPAQNCPFGNPDTNLQTNWGKTKR